MINDDSVTTPRDFVHSLGRGLSLITTFDAHHSRMNLDEISARSGISRSACRRLLLTLVAKGYVEYDGRCFSLSPRLLGLGYAQQSQLTLSDVAAPHADALAKAIDRHVSVAVLEGSDVMFVHRVGGRRIMRLSLTVGSRLPAHVTAIGRAMLAWIPEDQLANYLDQANFDQITPRSIRSPAELRKNLLRVRMDGWSLVSEELEQGLSAMAVPIRDRKGRVVAAINVSTQASSRAILDQEIADFLPELLRTAARIGADVHPTHTG
ncbi:IclR family transcriptional regulator C-terminal domain-containing protein [Aeromicrobium sp. CTD01-1L150]|uniref:IclR family transcriptional regulator domain-containing protein n=1 Tax=Aeromicrobium sp. CTD01-1L150 TaxID=3341830 RepID=UPI0035BF7F20